MKWFKHNTSNYRNASIQSVFNEVGYHAYAIYTIMELCAEKVEPKNCEKLQESDFIFTFNRIYFQSILRLKRSRVDLVLNLYQERGWFSSDVDDKEIKIKFPKLLKLLTSDQKKSRNKPESIETMSRLDRDIDIEKDLDTSTCIPSSLVNKDYKVITISSTTSDLKNQVTGVGSLGNEPVCSNISAKAKKTVSRRAYLEKPKSEAELFAVFPEETLSRWSDLYPDADYLNRESKKAFGYYVHDNPKKCPTSIAGWSRALGSWFERGWSKHVAQQKGAPLDTSRGFFDRIISEDESARLMK